MFHPESNPLAPKSIGPKKPEKELVEIWLGKDAAAEMDEREPETVDEEDLNPKKHELTEQEKRKLWEMKRPDEVTLRNIPQWEKLPDEETFKDEFKFEAIWKKEYRTGRPISDFAPRPEETLPSFQTKEVLSHAKVFDIADAIAKAKEKDSKHPDYLIMAEVLGAIDEAGYRPATLEELVAYGRDYWKPEMNPESLTKEERILQDAQAPSIYGLNSVFSDFEFDVRAVPYLRWTGDRRELYLHAIDDEWRAGARFLALRKSSPS